MCGLAGVVGDNAAENLHVVSGMTEALRHRGPDVGGVKVLDGAVLGHRRLRVIDLNPIADQPMTDESGRYWVLFNGEIYNFIELREQLIRLGHTFVSESDTEVIVHLVEDYGAEFASRLRGMFAIAVWDSRDKTLLLVRDRLGIKPLYYRQDGHRLLFASEARALARSSPRWDEYAVASYLSLGWIPGPSTVFEGVSELGPGHLLRWRDGAARLERWWHPPVPHGRLVDSHELGAVLDDAVRRHLVADVPVGIFLSAGLDSAAIATLVARAGGNPTAYTVAYDNAPDETEGARQVANQLGLRHTVVSVSGAQVLNSLDRIVTDMDQPSVDGLNSWVISEGARACGAVVALSGLGGDELFAGYSTFRHVPRIARFLSLSARLPYFLRATPTTVLGTSRLVAHSRVRRVLDTAKTPGQGAAYGVVRGLMCSGEIERIRGGWGRDLCRWPAVPIEDGLQTVTDLELHNYLPNQLLRDTDAMSMAHSLEVRVPLLDDEVVACALALQDNGRDLSGKQALAAAVDPSLIRIALGLKQTFTLPIEMWLRGSLRDWSADMLTTLAGSGLGFDRPELFQFHDDFQRGYAGWRPLWALAVLGAWVSRPLPA